MYILYAKKNPIRYRVKMFFFFISLLTWLQRLFLYKPTDPEFCTRSDVTYVIDRAFNH